MSRRLEALRTHLGVCLFLLTGVLLAQSGVVSAVALAATVAATTAVATALTLCAVLASRGRIPIPAGRIRTAIRDRERRTAYLPHRMPPDARGPERRAVACRRPRRRTHIAVRRTFSPSRGHLPAVAGGVRGAGSGAEPPEGPGPVPPRHARLVTPMSSSLRHDETRGGLPCPFSLPSAPC